jgi:hypothetical protein
MPNAQCPMPNAQCPMPNCPIAQKFIPENLMQTTAEYYCAYCGEPNLTFIDLTAGGQQSYVEDCQVCCNPNILYVRVDEDTLDIEIDTESES